VINTDGLHNRYQGEIPKKNFVSYSFISITFIVKLITESIDQFFLLLFNNTFITATETRLQIKANNEELLPHTIITNSTSRTFSQTNPIRNSTLNSNTNNMADQTLLAEARKARFEDLISFSGHSSEDVERFLKSIKNIIKANEESDNHEILENFREKLTQSAGIWFDNNAVDFRKWSDFETAFRSRYFSTTIIHKKFEQLKQFH
jgi:hypothetical protein